MIQHEIVSKMKGLNIFIIGTILCMKISINTCKWSVCWFKVLHQRKLDQRQTDNFIFKNSNIIIEGVVWNKRD